MVRWADELTNHFEDRRGYTTLTRPMPSGERWYVGTGMGGGEPLDAQIVVPVTELKGLSYRQIGEYVCGLIEDALALRAYGAADDILAKRGEVFKNYRDHWNYASDLREVLLAHANNPILARGGVVEKALKLIDDLARHVDRKEKGKTTKRYERAAARRDFDALFIAVGRRDGFRCAACSAVEDLQLDHIEPVAQGGETHPRNLQLLCRPCNLRKGERTIDFRNTQQSSEIQ